MLNSFTARLNILAYTMHGVTPTQQQESQYKRQGPQSNTFHRQFLKVNNAFVILVAIGSLRLVKAPGAEQFAMP